MKFIIKAKQGYWDKIEMIVFKIFISVIIIIIIISISATILSLLSINRYKEIFTATMRDSIN